MTDLALPGSIEPAHRPDLNKGFNPLTIILFAGILAVVIIAYLSDRGMVRLMRHLLRWQDSAELTADA